MTETENIETESKFDKGVKTTKRVAQFIAKRSVSATMVTLVHQNTKTFNNAQKAQLYIGAYLVGSKVADVCWDEASKKFDDAVQFIKTLKADYDEESNDKDVHVITDAE